MLSRSNAGERTGPAGWLLRAVTAAHTTVVVGQPVFAGVYLSGDFDALRWHELNANNTTCLSYVQLIVAAVLWAGSRRSWPFFGTLAVVVAEAVQYFAGLKGALWLHLPLGVTTIAGIVILTIAVWRTPFPRRTKRDQEDGDE
ncbi:hypothetical protein ACFY1C_31070 [Streptomyces sp. NPDC001279]|uniref:hypothetical protein n=1 Tax=Streptomyces sp. NPDC001279 TaxID=3364556 RepID=UPI0036B0AACC